MAYRADIEIAVKGAQELKRLQNEINATSKLVDGLNNYLTNIGSGGITRSINNLRNAVSSAADAFNKAALGTDEATIAATKYVQATDKLNAGLRERSALLDKITRQERAAAMVRVGVGMPAQQLLLPAARQGAPAMGGGARRRITGPVERLGGARTADEAAMALRFAQGLKEQVRPLSQIEALYAGITGEALKLQGIKALPDTQMLNASVRGIKQLETAEDMRNRELQETAQRLENIDRLEASRQRRAAKLRGIQDYYATPTTGGMANAGAGIQGPVMPPGGITKRGPGLGANLLKRLPGAISGGIIGGAFPLLFGQGGGAAAGGLVGGLAGGLLGPGGSFAGSLLGTLLGDIASQGQKIKQLGLDIGFSAQQANVLADGFKKANTDIEKFTGVVQNIRGLGLELEDQAELIKLTTSLTEKYGGQFDKVGNAITSALESGKVSQSTLNQLTSQGVNIQQALADKLGVSKDQLLEMAKKGKIDIQDLVDVLVDMGNKGVKATKKSASGMEQLGKAVQGLGTALGDLGAAIMKALKPALDWLAGALAGIIGLATRAINAIANMLSGGTAETVLANARARERLAAEGGPSVGTRYVAQKYQKRLEELQKEEQAKIVKSDSKVKPIDVSSLGRAPSSTGGGTDKAEKAAAREAARVAELVREQQLITLEYQKQQEIGAKIFAAEMARDPMLVRRLQGEQQLAEWGVKTANLLEKESSTAGKLAIAKAQQAEQALIRQKIEQDMAKIEQERKDRYDDIILDLDLELKLRTATTEEARQQLRIENEIQKLKKAGFTPAQIADIAQKKQQAAAPLTPQETIAQRAGALSDELTKLVSLGTQVTQIAESIGTAFGESFKGVISGAMTAQEALSSFFQSVADRFLDMAAQIIAKWIEMTILNSVLNLFPGGGMGLAGATAAAGKLNPAVGFGVGPLGFRAAGGSVMAGSPYVVGERGPELFVPGRSGTIVPNNALSAGGATSVVVNVDAGASNVQGNDAQASQLGKVIGLAVQQELIKQKRPGGLLS